MVPYIKTNIEVTCPKCGRKGRVWIYIDRRGCKTCFIYHKFADKCTVSCIDLKLRYSIDIDNIVKTYHPGDKNKNKKTHS